MRRPLILAALLGASLVPCIAATDGVAPGWFLAGNQPQSYTSGLDANGTAFLASKTEGKITGFGTLMQSFQARDFVGKRVRFTAMVRSENVRDWAGLWMRVDDGAKAVAFDNMQSRAIKGTTGWNTYEVVLDVPESATKISFGALVSSNGEIWLREIKFGPVGPEVPPTAVPMPTTPTKPVNLELRQ